MTYDWQKDSFESWCLAIYWQAITRGLARPARPLEMYWAEAAGASCKAGCSLPRSTPKVERLP